MGKEGKNYEAIIEKNGKQTAYLFDAKGQLQNKQDESKETKSSEKAEETLCQHRRRNQKSKSGEGSDIDVLPSLGTRERRPTARELALTCPRQLVTP